jgi:transcriptional regulator with XRE-family HTH domain
MIGPWEREHRPLLRTIVGDVLRRIRLEQGRTLADVASEARVSMPYLSELERGRKEASSEILAAICAALDIDLSDLLAEARRELVQGPPAPVIQLDRAGYNRQVPSTPSSAGGSGDVVCLFASAGLAA